jgi:hypothetical protein
MQESLQSQFQDYIAGEIPQFKILPVVIDQSQTITVGSVLASKGISSEGEKFVKCNSAAAQSIEQKPVCVALEAVTVGEGESATINACFMGELNVTLNAGGSDTQYTHEDALRARGIYIRKNI